MKARKVESAQSSDSATAEDSGLVTESKQPHGKFREWLDAIEKHGPLMTRDMAGAALAVSRQRVHQLISKGQLRTIRVGNYRYVPLAALEAFRANRKFNGRPPAPESSAARRRTGSPKESVGATIASQTCSDSSQQMA